MKRTPKKKLDFSHLVERIEKNLGAGSVQKFKEIKFISTGIPAIDWAFGGGVPIGRLIEIFGDFSSGKTLLAMHLLKEVLKLGGLAAFIDTEFAFSTNMAKNIGLNLNRLMYFQPECLEDVFKVADSVIDAAAAENPQVLIGIVWDSVASASPKKELEEQTGAPEMGLRARIISQGLRRLKGKVSKRNIVLLLTNQLRHKIGVLYGPTWTTSGGEAPRIYSSVRAMLQKGNKISKDKKAIGREGSLEVIKNKIAPPFRKVGFEVHFDRGILPLSGFLNCLVERNIILRKSSWYYFGEVKFQRKDLPGFLKSHPELRDLK